MREIEYDHKQVFFTEGPNGKPPVTVDEGLLDILTLMRDLGLKTQFSCEDNRKKAYVNMNQSSARLFEKMMKNADLSEESRMVANKFLGGPRTYDFCINTRNGDSFRVINRGKHKKEYFTVERLIQNAPHWLRTTYRWPVTMTPRVQVMLEELSQTASRD